MSSLPSFVFVFEFWSKRRRRRRPNEQTLKTVVVVRERGRKATRCCVCVTSVRSQVLVCADRYCAKNPYKRDCNTVKAVDSSKIRTSIRHKPVCVVVCSNNSSSIHHTICQKSPFYVWGEDAYTIILYYQTKKTAANSRVSLYFRTLLCSSILYTVILIHTRGQWHDLLGHSVRKFSENIVWFTMNLVLTPSQHVQEASAAHCQPT